MSDDKLFEQIRVIVASENGIDDHVFKSLVLAALSDIRGEQHAQRLELEKKASIKHTHADIDALKKRDWYSVVFAIVMALATSAMAWLKK